jgi:carbonic anhydrase
MVAALTVAICGSATLLAQEPKPTPAGSLQRLKEGNARFVADKPSKRDAGIDRRKELAKGQRPFAAVLTCSDSHVAPELLFDTGLGDLYVVRVGGNIADPAVVGSIEYAVERLHVPLVVVLGHESCDAVEAALAGKPIPGDLGWLVKQIKLGDKLPTDKDAKLTAGIRNNVLAAARDLELRSKVIHEEVVAKKVVIMPAMYLVKTGQVEWLTVEKKAEKVENPKAKEGVQLDPSPAPPPIFERPARFPRLRAMFQRWR